MYCPADHSYRCLVGRLHISRAFGRKTHLQRPRVCCCHSSRSPLNNFLATLINSIKFFTTLVRPQKTPCDVSDPLGCAPPWCRFVTFFDPAANLTRHKITFGLCRSSPACHSPPSSLTRIRMRSIFFLSCFALTLPNGSVVNRL